MADRFTEMVKGKDVLFVPTYSMRSYETGLYDLSKDGNMARVMSFVNSCEANTMMVTVPMKGQLVNDDYTGNVAPEKIDRVYFMGASGYGKNARETRDSVKLYTLVKGIFNLFDIVVIEQQAVMQRLLDDGSIDNSKLVYWCVASHVEGHDIWFVDEFKDVDKYIASMVPTVCANEKQVEYLQGNSFVGFFYDATWAFKSTVFFPFRLSDPEYHFYDKLIPFLDSIQGEPGVAYDLLLTDPNDSIDRSQLGHQQPLVVPSDHRLYTAILKGKPIIPYFAEIDVIRHISIEEMVQAGCCVICYKNKTYDMVENVHMAEDEQEFKQILRHAIKTEAR